MYFILFGCIIVFYKEFRDLSGLLSDESERKVANFLKFFLTVY